MRLPTERVLLIQNASYVQCEKQHELGLISKEIGDTYVPIPSGHNELKMLEMASTFLILHHCQT